MTEGTVERAGLNILGLVTNLASQHLQTELTSEVVASIMMMMMRMRRRMSQKIALKSLKIEYVVAWGISLDILPHQIFLKKSYGFTAI